MDKCKQCWSSTLQIRYNSHHISTLLYKYQQLLTSRTCQYLRQIFAAAPSFFVSPYFRCLYAFGFMGFGRVLNRIFFLTSPAILILFPLCASSGVFSNIANGVFKSSMVPSHACVEVRKVARLPRKEISPRLIPASTSSAWNSSTQYSSFAVSSLCSVTIITSSQYSVER